MLLKKTFDLLGDDMVELTTQNETLRNQTGDSAQKYFEESKARLSKQINDEKRAILIMSRSKKQIEEL